MKQPYNYKQALAAGMAFSLALLPAVAIAQRASDPIEQVRPADRREARVPVEQVSTATRDVTAPGAAAGPAAPAPVQQVGSPEEVSRGPRQLTEVEREAKPPVQLYQGGPTAQAPEALSQRSEGRTGAVEPVEGEDACDPADEAPNAEVCKRIIETRSAEFVRPDPTTLSPEQRLLIQQRLREGPTSGEGATRRLARQGDADSLEGQGVASIVLSRPSEPREEAPIGPTQDSAAEAAAAILEIIGQPGTAVIPPE